MSDDYGESVWAVEQRFRDAVAGVQARVGLPVTGEWDASVEAAVLMREADFRIMAEQAEEIPDHLPDPE